MSWPGTDFEVEKQQEIDDLTSQVAELKTDKEFWRTIASDMSLERAISIARAEAAEAKLKQDWNALRREFQFEFDRDLQFQTQDLRERTEAAEAVVNATRKYVNRKLGDWNEHDLVNALSDYDEVVGGT